MTESPAMQAESLESDSDFMDYAPPILCNHEIAAETRARLSAVA
jgi:hypothetical protein